MYILFLFRSQYIVWQCDETERQRRQCRRAFYYLYKILIYFMQNKLFSFSFRCVRIAEKAYSIGYIAGAYSGAGRTCSLLGRCTVVLVMWVQHPIPLQNTF